jgi:phosphoribosylamine-glycine ligase
MGAYAPVSIATPGLMLSIRDRILLPTLTAMRNEGCSFTGLLFAGLMLTEQGPKVVEFNCRFGDPETQAILPLLGSSLLVAMRAIADGGSIRSLDPFFWKKGASVTTVVAAEGYPGSVKGGDVITLPETPSGVTIFHAGTALNDEGALVTAGGRVLTVTAVAESFATAQDASRTTAEAVQFRGRQLRRDIGWRELQRLS